MGLFGKKRSESDEKPEVISENEVSEVAEEVEETIADAEQEVETVSEAVEESVPEETAVEELVPVENLAEDLVDHVEIPEVKEEVIEETTEEVADVASEEIVETCEEVTEEISEEVAEEAAEEVSEETEVVTKDSQEETIEEPAERTEAESDEEKSDEAKDEEEKAEPTEEEKKILAKDKEAEAKERSAVYVIFDTLRYISIGILVGILLVVFVIQRNDVYGSSMEPTLHTGDAVFVEMISVYTGNLDRGDIVTIDAKGMEGYTHEENLIKRIVGLPGETIKIADGNVYINGVLLDESDYLPEGTKTYVGAEGQARGYQEITLGPDEYYCMGDNRGGSNDSRRMGPFKKEKIEAKVLMRIYPFNKIKFY
ncbi:MAG: signal peptidase I [Clostridiales bacterium]|nr:signal peptidase I [Candidatus Scatonaster coprocaballi]